MNKTCVLSLIAVSIFLPSGCSTGTPGTGADRTQTQIANTEEKGVMALQAFLPTPDSEHLRVICMEALAITNAEVAFRWGAVPHVTISAWRVARDEQKLVLDKLQSSHLRELKAIDIPCRLHKSAKSGKSSWFLVPTDEARPLLDDFRNEALRAMDVHCEDFEGRSGTTWWPHLTLFSIPAAHEPEAAQLVAKIGKITAMRLNALAIVGFHQGIQTLATVQLAAD